MQFKIRLFVIVWPLQNFAGNLSRKQRSHVVFLKQKESNRFVCFQKKLSKRTKVKKNKYLS